MRHSCGTLLRDSLVGHSCRKLLWDKGGSQSAAPATKSAHGGSQSAVPATKSAHGGSQSAAPATKSADGGSQSAAPATKSDNIISCKLQQNLHHATRLEWFRPILSILPATKIAISAETCHENRASMPHPHTQIPMARPHPTPQTHHSPNANPNVTAQQTADLTKRCACAVKCITFLARHIIFMQITM